MGEAVANAIACWRPRAKPRGVQPSLVLGLAFLSADCGYPHSVLLDENASPESYHDASLATQRGKHQAPC